MQKLYLDCDGVILDTINKSYQMIKEQKIEGEKNIRKFYRELDWKQLIIDSGEINDSISKIIKLSKNFDIEILTHINSDNEIKEKKEFFAKKLPGIKVITVPKNTNKCDIVNSKDNILVDDYIPNLEKWKEKGGIPVKFSDSGKECEFITITDLLELLEIDFNVKKKVKEK